MSNTAGFITKSATNAFHVILVGNDKVLAHKTPFSNQQAADKLLMKVLDADGINEQYWTTLDAQQSKSVSSRRVGGARLSISTFLF